MLVLAAPLGAPATAQGGPARVGTTDRATVTYRPPVDAPVTDPFRAPLTPYGPGNRGIDYATAPGTSVRAAADGTVAFAGPVAGGLHVTVLHADGIRTTYSFLAAIRVVRGEMVRGGDEVGVAGAMLHIGARRGDTYIDPASLWGRAAGPPAVRLVPLDGYRPQPAVSVNPGSALPAPRRTVVANLIGLAASAVDAAAAGVGGRPP
ncbi:MAG: peptidoglycan DD-metalloendopeptidase family protein [Actinomycetota bacterium]|nr:peptidoglycan DD-metalloendopeptidase family protein [Actinomycetota bacterium]